MIRYNIWDEIIRSSNFFFWIVINLSISKIEFFLRFVALIILKHSKSSRNFLKFEKFWELLENEKSRSNIFRTPKKLLQAHYYPTQNITKFSNPLFATHLYTYSSFAHWETSNTFFSSDSKVEAPFRMMVFLASRCDLIKTKGNRWVHLMLLAKSKAF